MTLAGLLAGSRAMAETPVTEKARAHFDAGTRHLQDPSGAHHREAYAELKAAYAESPSWRILGNLGIAAARLERDGEAAAAFEDYLELAGDELSEAERDTFERSLEQLRQNMAHVAVHANRPGVKITDERRVDQDASVVNDYGPVVGSLSVDVRAGRHRMRASLEGHPDQTWEVELVPRKSHSKTFQFDEPIPPSPVHPRAAALERDTGTMASDTTPHRPPHDGVLFRFNLGAGGGVANVGEFELSGVAGLVSLDLGYTIHERLVVLGRISGQTIVNPSLSVDGEDYGESDGTTVSFYMLGAGVTYYLPSNLYVTGVAGLTSASIEVDGFEYEMNTGFGLEGDLGYEWSAGGEWGLGLCGRIEAHSASDSADTLSVVSLGALFSATYN